MEDLAVDDGGVLVEDSDVDEGGASTYTQREVTASGIETRQVGFRVRTSNALLVMQASTQPGLIASVDRVNDQLLLF